MPRASIPPKRAHGFLSRLLREEIAEEVLGDLDEKFYLELQKRSVLRAKLNYWYQVFNYLRPFAIRKSKGHLNQYTMYGSYVKVGWRNLAKNKGYSFINIVGLATGMAVAMLIGIWIADELSFNSYFKNSNSLAEVLCVQTNEGITYTGTTIASTIEDPLRTKFADDFKALALVSYPSETTVAAGEKKLIVPSRWVQHQFPAMFTVQMLSGSADALKNPSSTLLSRSLAKALFGNDDPLNKIVRAYNRLDLTVGGVYEDFPRNTTFSDTQFLLSWENQENWNYRNTDWQNHSCLMFVQLVDHADSEVVTQKIKSLPTPHIKDWKEEIKLYPLDRLHLYGAHFQNGNPADAHIQFVWLFGTIGAFVLLLACINFMNLSTARSEGRAREVGIRKTIGSVRSQLISQFLIESVVVALLAFLLSLLLTQLSLPLFNTLADKQTSIPWANSFFWIAALGFALLTGLISGSYPAFYLSAFKPIKVLKGTFKTGRLALAPRKILVVLQFTVSISLLIGTIIVFRQIQFAKHRLPGYSRDGLITVTVNTPELTDHFDVIRNEVMQTGAVESIARASQSPAHFGNNNSVDWRGKDPGLVVFFRNVSVSPEFGKTIGWKIKEGRDFAVDSPADTASVLLNETAIKIMGFKEPVGETIKFWDKSYTVKGIVYDMVTQSPYKPIEPCIFLADGWLGVIVMRLNQSISVRDAISKIEPVFRKNNPSAPFVFNFVDEVYNKKFASEERIGNLAAFFTILAVFISCLGLFGLASFVAEQRTKEIGIRKVLGASVSNLWQMLSKDFLILVIISGVISIPLSFLFMNNWLMQYQYKTPISWEVFASAISGAIVLTLLTVSYHAVRAALASPVNSLRSE
jgi:putative ABC transport system permease protein